MKILLTGANGFIGGHIAQALQAAHHEIIPISRHFGWNFINMLEAKDWLPHLHGVDAVINSVGIIAEVRGQTFSHLHEQAPAALFRASEQAGVRRVIQISALGVDERAVVPYQCSKKVADDALRERSLDWFILRPSLVYGAGGASMAFFQRLAMLPLIPVVGDGQQLIQPVHISDVVATVLACLQEIPVRRTVDVVGPHALTFVAWLQTLRRKCGKTPAPVLHIPFRLALAAAAIGRYGLPLLHPDNLTLLRLGNTSEVQPLAEILGRLPLAVEEAL